MSLANVPTYHAGIAQSKAYRVLKQLMARLLKKYGLTMMDWSILGLVHDAGKKGIRITDLAEKLDTTKAFVTTHINMLESKQLVTRDVGRGDTRVRIVTLLPSAKATVNKIETEIREVMRAGLYTQITPEDMTVYVKVLEQISKLETKLTNGRK